MGLAVGISIAFALALAVAVYLLWRAYRRLDELDAQMGQLAHDLENANEELASVLTEVSGSRIIVEVINPMTLARALALGCGAGGRRPPAHSSSCLRNRGA